MFYYNARTKVSKKKNIPRIDFQLALMQISCTYLRKPLLQQNEIYFFWNFIGSLVKLPVTIRREEPSRKHKNGLINGRKLSSLAGCENDNT